MLCLTYVGPLTLEMDHWALNWLMTDQHKNGRLARWAFKPTQDYDFVIRHNFDCDETAPY